MRSVEQTQSAVLNMPMAPGAPVGTAPQPGIVQVPMTPIGTTGTRLPVARINGAMAICSILTLPLFPIVANR